jgi:hypothetical protein
LHGMQITTTTPSKTGKRPARSRAEWLKEVTAWRSSGQRAGEYAQAHGLHAGTLAYWASRLRGEGGKKRATRRAKPSAFVQLRVRGRKSAPAVHAPSAQEAFDVWLTNGRRVRVSASFDATVLTRLLAVVEAGASC